MIFFERRMILAKRVDGALHVTVILQLTHISMWVYSAWVFYVGDWGRVKVTLS